MTPDPHQPSSSSFAGDFAPGEVLIGRYRIVALVGEGGMGQVYLADDLVLGQPVAVKFLPEHVAAREGGLDRFRAEVRHARDVTHPNVARVHDIGEVDGRHFLTMEFVDGEDLASLVRRIGRLPKEKAAEIAQQICAGLAEAHERGLLHRDLKPANVMLDAEGRVKLTDFGLSIPADASADGALAGTPQYMAPEQLSGVPANVQSEVYSLGLLLYELYTGKRALHGRNLDELRREHEEGSVQAPSTVLEELQPEVDAVLTRCLARDPAERPRSVREVAAALPGGDPLAAALAAGETPAPELVAGARTEGVLAPRVALALALGCGLLLAVLAVLRTSYLDRIGFSHGKPPAVLDERARELFVELTGLELPPHEVQWYAINAPLQELRRALPPQDRATEGAAAGPAVDWIPLVRHVRLSPADFLPAGGVVSMSNPMPGPGDARLGLDAEGTLVFWSHVTDEAGTEDGGAPAASEPADPWGLLFARAGLDPDTLETIEPDLPPPVFADTSAAWRVRGTDAGEGGAADEVTVHAAALRGQPVHFELRRGGERLGITPSITGPKGPASYILLLVVVAAALVAWRNVRKGRAYVSGALWVGAFSLATHIVLAFAWPSPHELATFGFVLQENLSMSLHTAARVTIFYLALEPFARRRWPGALVAWTRLLEGRVRDPMVGREVLIGLTSGLATMLVFVSASIGLEAAGVQPWAALPFLPNKGLESPIEALCQFVHSVGDVVMFVGVAVFLLVGLRALLKNAWLANGAWFAFFVSTALLGEGSGVNYGFVLAATGGMSLALLLLTRLGFLSVVGFATGLMPMVGTALTLRPSDWYFGSSVIVFALLAGVVTWAYRAAVAGRSAFD